MSVYTVVFSAALYVTVQADDEGEAIEKATPVAERAAYEFETVASIGDDYLVIHAGEDPVRILNEDPL